jgi:hypothetical protein
MVDDPLFAPLLESLRTVPAIHDPIGSGVGTEVRWWVKFGIDIAHPLAWNVVQELTRSELSVARGTAADRIHASLAAAVYDEGPKDFLSWVIESTDSQFTPGDCAEWLKGRLPRPLSDPAQWNTEDQDI